MSGVIAAALAALIGAASVLGSVDCSQIIQEAEYRKQQAQMQEQAGNYLIAIDAGHQGQGNFGQEPIGPGASETKNKVAAGTSGRTTGVPEYQLTLDISLQLRDALEEKGYQVLMIRETNDVDISNAERAQMANEAGADVFIRIHANGSDSSSANGAMTICQTSTNPYNSEYYEESKRLSELVLDEYTEATGIRRERVWETDTMSGINWCMVPVTILELGYMTNPDEDTKMQDPEFQGDMVDGIVAGIEAYLEEKKESGQNTDSAEPETDSDEPESPSEGETADEAAAIAAAAAETDADDDAADDASTETTAESATMAADASSTATTAETATTEEPDEAAKARAAKEAEMKELKDDLYESSFATAHMVALSASSAKEIVKITGSAVKGRYEQETDASMAALEKDLKKEIGKLGGKWSLYLKRLDTGRVIGINADKKMIAASLIKLFVAGEFYTQTGSGKLSEEKFGSQPDSMINVSDNTACNNLISAVGMSNVNEFAKKNGYKATQLNRKMLENNGTENYTSVKDCGKMLEKVLNGTYVSKHASERILEKGLKAQQRRSKIPAGVPSGVKTANKTGELNNVDNDAAIVWSPACTYILCIMSSDTGGRISEIVKLSSMVYNGINE